MQIMKNAAQKRREFVTTVHINSLAVAKSTEPLDVLVGAAVIVAGALIVNWEAISALSRYPRGL